MKRNYRKVLLSLCIIAMSLSLIVGATFAIFESENKIKIPVSSGEIDITATTTITQAWSAEWDVNLGEYVDRDVTLLEGAADFTCGGKVFYDAKEQAVNLKNIAPGDGVELKVELTNASTIKAKYNVNVARTGGNAALVKALKIEIDDSKLTGEEVESGWRTADIPADGSASLGYVTVKISLPMTEGIDNLQDMSCELAITVNAVQFNAHIEIPEVETGDVTLDSNLIDKVNNAIASADIESAPAIVFGTWGNYQDAVTVADDYSDYEDGLNIPGEINARIFRIENKTRSFRAVELEEGAGIGMDALYILAGNSITAAENGEESFTFADSEYIYVDMSGVDFSNTTSLGNMFKNSQIETLIMCGVNLSKVTDMNSGDYLTGSNGLSVDPKDVNNVFHGCTNLKVVDFSNANLSSLQDGINVFGKDAGLLDLFYGCESLTEVNFSGANLSNLTTLKYAFLRFANLTSIDFSNADLSKVITLEGICQHSENIESVNLAGAILTNLEDMGSMFAGKKNLTSVDLSGLDLSKLKDVSGMFNGCVALEEVDISGVDLSNVTTMQNMFYACTALKSVDFSGADLHNVTTMQDMFAESANGIACLNLTSVTFAGADLSGLTRLYRMFNGCTALTSVDFSNSKLTGVMTMQYMFSGCTALESFVFSEVFAGADFSNMTSSDNMNYMFQNCSGLVSVDFTNAIIGATEMEHIFHGCTSLTEVKGTKDALSKVISMDSMFQGCTSLIKCDFFAGADLSGLTDMYGMFQNCTKLTDVDFSSAKLHNVTTMDRLFYNTGSNPGIQNVNFSNIEFDKLSLISVFGSYTPALETVNFSGSTLPKVTSLASLFKAITTLKEINFSEVKIPNAKFEATMFQGCTGLQTMNFANAKLSSSTTSISAFSSSYAPNVVTVDFTNMEFPNVTGSINSLFNGCKSLTTVNFSGVKLPNATGGSSANTTATIFGSCASLTTVDLSNADLSNIITFKGLFQPAKASLVSVNLSGAKFNKAQTFAGAFSGCSVLETVNLTGAEFSSDLTAITEMFNGCTALKEIDLSSFDFTNVTSLYYMFINCSSLTSIDFSVAKGSALENLTNAQYLFKGCSSLKTVDLGDFNPTAQFNASYMFRDCAELGYIYVNGELDLSTGRISSATSMFAGCTALFERTGFNNTGATYAKTQNGYFTVKG